MDSHHMLPSATPNEADSRTDAARATARPPASATTGTTNGATADVTASATTNATASATTDATTDATTSATAHATAAGSANASAAASAAGPAGHFRHKAVAGLLAAVLGGTGAQLWYLGLPRAWLVLAFSLLTVGTALRADPWYFSPAFFLFLLPVVGGFIHALVLCLTSDEKFDARYNVGQTRRSRTGWLPVLVAILTLAVGSSILVTGLALFFQAVFEGRWF